MYGKCLRAALLSVRAAHACHAAVGQLHARAIRQGARQCADALPLAAASRIYEVDIIIKDFLTALCRRHISKVAAACCHRALRHGSGKRRRNALAAHSERRQRTVSNGVEGIVCSPTLRKGAERKEAKQGGKEVRPNGME